MYSIALTNGQDKTFESKNIHADSDEAAYRAAKLWAAGLKGLYPDVWLIVNNGGTAKSFAPSEF